MWYNIINLHKLVVWNIPEKNFTRCMILFINCRWTVSRILNVLQNYNLFTLWRENVDCIKSNSVFFLHFLKQTNTMISCWTDVARNSIVTQFVDCNRSRSAFTPITCRVTQWLVLHPLLFLLHILELLQRYNFHLHVFLERHIGLHLVFSDRHCIMLGMDVCVLWIRSNRLQLSKPRFFDV